MKGKILHLVGQILLAVIFGGGALFLFAIFGLLSGIPLYLYYGILAAGVVLLVAYLLLGSGFFQQRGKRRIWLGLLAAGLALAAYMGYGAWRDSLPTVTDRHMLLYQYQPFDEDNKLAAVQGIPAFQLSGHPLPKLDGATALYPVYAAFAQAVYSEDAYRMYANAADGYNVVHCSGTIGAYERLVAGTADLIFAAAPSQDQLDMAERAGMQLHMTPIGREAFVFFVNSRNPVSELTVEEVQGIYSGQILNWRELGGRNQSIRAFQRMENSGSQSALLNLMGGVPLMEPATEERIGAMDGIIREVADYRNFKNAIGFSFLYYATEMVANDQIKLLALNGVAPTKETIRDGSYPLASSFYAITASPIGQPPPEETRQELSGFIAWILSAQGQQLIEDTGYVPLKS